MTVNAGGGGGADIYKCVRGANLTQEITKVLQSSLPSSS